MKLEWLEKTVALMQVGTDIEEMRNILLDYVGKTRSVGQAKTRGSGEITVTILLSDHKRGGLGLVLIGGRAVRIFSRQDFGFVSI